MRQSKYNIIKKIKNKGYLLYNTLHQNLVYIKEEDYNDFCNMNNDNPYYQTWIKENLIVEDSIDEYKEKLTKLNSKNDFQAITIFTTTACNARCSYCFESGICTISMDEKDLDSIANNIIKQIKSKRLHVTWFGGEPLLMPGVIDKLTKKFINYCNDNDIKYTSTIISNGSLLNDEIIHKINNEWNTAAVQISLDGTEKTYNKIKNYKDNSNFKIVIENIKKLNFKRKTTIRVNFNSKNIKNCLKLIKYLYKEGLDSNKIYLYFHPITGEGDKDYSLLNKQFSLIFDTLYKYGYIKSISYFNMHFSMNHCQAENELSFSVFPNGNVVKCQRERPESSLFNIKDENFLTKLNEKWAKEHVDGNDTTSFCSNCISYPLCKGGCKMHNFSNLTKMRCDRCYIYHGCYDSILNCLAKIYKDSFE